MSGGYSPGGGGCPQTPWASNIDAADYYLMYLSGLYLSDGDHNLTLELARAVDGNSKEGALWYDYVNDVAVCLFPTVRSDGCAPSDNDVFTYCGGNWYAAPGGGGASYSFIDSLFENAGTVNLVNDANTLPYAGFYGMDSISNKGWYCWEAIQSPWLAEINANNHSLYGLCTLTFSTPAGGYSNIGCLGKMRFCEVSNSSSGCGDLWAESGTLYFIDSFNVTHDLLAAGSSSPAGGCYAIQTDDGLGAFCGNQNFLYNPSTSTFCQIGLVDLDSGGTFARTSVSSDCNWWTFFSDVCGMGSVYNALSYRFNSMCGKQLRVDDYGGCYVDIFPGNQVNIYDGLSNLAHFGINSCAAAIWTDCGPSIFAGYNTCDRFQVNLNTYNDSLGFQDYLNGFSGTYCDLIFNLTNGCTYGYTQLNFDGLGLGGVVNSLSGPLYLAQGNCEFLCSCSGYTETNGTWNLYSSLCIGGNSTYSGTFDPNSISSIIVECGLITGIM